MRPRSQRPTDVVRDEIAATARRRVTGARLAHDVEAFLAGGGVITRLPGPGEYSAQELGARVIDHDHEAARAGAVRSRARRRGSANANR